MMFILNYNSGMVFVSNLYNIRTICLSTCMTDNFPLVPCSQNNITIVYNNNNYSTLFDYPNPYTNNYYMTKV